jgi:DNA-binding NarL/FixJ family response regulator
VSRVAVRVLLVEDSDVYRSSLELLLAMQGGIDVAGAVATGAEALAVCPDLRPDVVLMDLRLPGIGGVAATAEVLASCPGTSVVCLTAEATPEERQAITAAGAVAIVEKGQPIDLLVTAIRAAAGS